jgi:hypothetical protein
MVQLTACLELRDWLLLARDGCLRGPPSSIARA